MRLLLSLHRIACESDDEGQSDLSHSRSFPTMYMHRLLAHPQYFGSGKTTLGMQFFEQIKIKAEVQAFFESKLKQPMHAMLKAEWESLLGGLGSAQHVFVDVDGMDDMVKGVSANITRVAYAEAEREPQIVAEQIVKHAAVHGGATFVHVDEVGGSATHNINFLRRLAKAVWKELRALSHAGETLPTIYFLVTGRSTKPFESIGPGTGRTLPCRSRFLVLDLLKAARARWSGAAVADGEDPVGVDCPRREAARACPSPRQGRWLPS